MHVKLFHITFKGAFKSLAHQIPCTKLLKFMCYHENTKKMYISRVSHECYFSFVAKTTKRHISQIYHRTKFQNFMSSSRLESS
jgi:hypothetical protein